VEALQPGPMTKDSQVEVLGRWSRAGTNIVLQGACYREISGEATDEKTNLPVLTTVEQIKRLTRTEWQRGYPVKIRGVVTTVLDSGFFIQDSTEAIYARWQPPLDERPRVGDYWEVDGVTFAEFAPNIRVEHAARLGVGTLPEPLHPTWDQLINGSLDTEYVEIQGIVTAVDPDGVTLLTRSGKISVQLPDVQPQRLLHYKNALVRVRGCVMPVRNIQTQQVELGRIGLTDASIDVDEPAPADPFSAPIKHASDLLLFDPRAGAFQRVKIDGQIVQQRSGEYFMMDGGDGLRFIPAANIKMDVGDQVEVVGFPELGGPSPVLREAVVRRIGTARLPPPQVLSVKTLISRRYDSTLVRVQARLTDISFDRSDQVLELEAGTRGFEARLRTTNGLLPGLSPGSLLELTGVYEGQGGDLASGREIDSFDLLLNSAADVTVLARPSWWTLRHTVTVIGAMALAILAAMVWITLLHRQVEERSAQLAAEVRRREQTERQGELEKERARIARDLHDDLGATLTQIRFLSALESRDAQVPEGARGRMGQISEKSREMVASLDEIVWAVNPTNDSLPSLANYLCHFAEEFFQPTPVRCRLDVDDSLPPAALTSEVRHNLYLAVREALNNISKHSQATEVWLRIKFQQPELRILIEDNGRGFSPAAGAPSGEGLANMRRRLEEIGGRFEFSTQPGAGTTYRFWLPLVSTFLYSPVP
ncbi:MAG TPA: sensor histidine kinase, partial [Verrucomicrobiae bacterium]|nr:sensor histidine kinase [Verrucomicrobiae bacterium]